MRIALASPRTAHSIDECLSNIERLIARAANEGAEVVCFPEAYLPGLRGLDFEVAEFTVRDQERSLAAVAQWTRAARIMTILGVEWHANGARHIAAAVLDSTGTLVGVQTKNQLDPSEDLPYAPGRTRQLFEVNGHRFGIAICHEGFRYPETVRWAARRGAKVVFHPHCTGSDRVGPTLTNWGAADAPYYEKAIMCRALENTVYVAAVNYAFRYQESATCVVDPAGTCVAQLPYGTEGVLVQDLDTQIATGLLASRYAPERYS